MRNFLSTRFFKIAAVLVVVFAGSIFLSWRNSRAAFLNLEERDPLFDFPSISDQDFAQMDETMQKASDQMKKFYPILGSSHFYPFDFWAQARNLAKTRRAFLEQPTFFKATQLLFSEQRTLSAYQSELRGTQKAWKAANAERKNKVSDRTIFLFLPGVATDIPAQEQSLNLIEKNSEGLKTTLSHRWWCLLFSRCEAPATGATASISKKSPPSVLLLPNDYLEKTFEALRAYSIDTRIYIVKSPCFNQKEDSLFVLGRTSYDGNEAFIPKLATNSFFRRIDPSQLTPQYRGPYEAHFDYSFQRETILYMCPDLTYYPTLGAMTYLVEEARSNPVAKHFESDSSEEAKELRKTEIQLSGASFVDESLVNEYAKALASILDAMPSSQTANSSAYKNARERLRIWQTKSGNLGEIMTNIAIERDIYKETFPAIKHFKPFLVYALIAYQHANLLFAEWNPSVWRINEHMNTLIPDTSNQPSTLTDYWTLEKTLTKDQIEKIQELSIVNRDMRTPK